MKKLALALVFGALSVGAVSAQTDQKTKVKTNKKEVKVKQEVKADHYKKREEKSPEERADHEVKKLTETLGLNNDQASRLKEISLRKSQQMAALKERAGDNKEAMRSEMKAVKTTYHTELKSILTADQFTKYEAYKAERKAKMKARHGDRKDHGKHKGQYKDKK